ncbi:AlwI family type II restriction endonuclease [bacterium]|nr:AlwI family type II restriction endonuclease [bacterium]
MKKTWSISTTVRNPERLRNFLAILKLLENQCFDDINQIKYQILLIQNKLYKPINIPVELKNYFENTETEMPFEVAQKVFNLQNYNDPPMRGRQSVNPLNKLGFCIARENQGLIKITELGNKFLEGDYDISYIFLKSLLKLQFPNPCSSDFTEKNGFDVMPLIATMHLINKINTLNDKKGLSRNEFCLFIPTLINANFIDSYVQNILDYRNSKDKKKFSFNFISKFFNLSSEQEVSKKNNCLLDYGDNTMRYFRLTRFFKVTSDIFGKNWRIDLESSRQVEIKQLLNIYSGQAIKFKTIENYLNYLSDLTLPKLPSEKTQNLKEIINFLLLNIKNLIVENHFTLTEKEKNMLNENFNIFSKKQLEKLIINLRDLSLELKVKQKKIFLLKDTNEILKIIQTLRETKTLKKFQPEQFEKLLFEALKIMNDEIKIKPNYPTDDDGEPISHASGNKPDIECFYKTYNAICEVTLDNSNFQWIRETQPVMRHLRDFENKNPQKVTYCLFISTKIHQDTFYHFWISGKHGYNGLIQKIIPLTTEQFAELLEIFFSLAQKGKRFSHLQVKELYEKITQEANKSDGHLNWSEKIPLIIKNWKSQFNEN